MGACHECTRTDQACTISEKNSSISRGSEMAGASEHRASSSDLPTLLGASNQASRDHSEVRNYGAKGRERTIVTSFSHPVGFNCDNEQPCKPCHFCIQPELRLVGYGKTNASIIDIDDSGGFVELAGGHRERRIEPTALCTECTTSRLSIIMCEPHKMTPILDLKHSPQGEANILDSVLDGTLMNGDIDNFCSICCSLAALKCCAGQEGDPEGCGLKLCDRCTATLVGRYDGDLGNMLTHEAGTVTEEHQIGLRADAELLMPDGVVMRYLSCLSRQ